MSTLIIIGLAIGITAIIWFVVIPWLAGKRKP